ncbi:MAG: Hpt domain-containing protein [Inquilinaceae bacterium]
MQDQVRALIERHCSTLKDEAAAVTAALSGWGATHAITPADLLDAVNHAHKIKGSSGSIGFGDVSAAAAALEQFLRDLNTQSAAPSAEDRAKANALNTRLQVLARDVKAEQSTLYHRRFPKGREASQPLGGRPAELPGAGDQ